MYNEAELSSNRTGGNSVQVETEVKNLLSQACAHVLHKTLNLVISRSVVWPSRLEKCTKIYNARAGPLFFSLYPIVL